MNIPLESAHLYIGKGDDNPQEFEKLNVEHESIKPLQRSEPHDSIELDQSTVDYLCETAIEHWNLVSEDLLTQSMADPMKK